MYPVPYCIRHPYSISYSTSVLKLENRSRITLFENGDCDREIVDFFGRNFRNFSRSLWKIFSSSSWNGWPIEIGDYGTKFDRLYVLCAMINCWWSSLPHAVNRLRILFVGRRKRWRSSVAQKQKGTRTKRKAANKGSNDRGGTRTIANWLALWMLALNLLSDRSSGGTWSPFHRASFRFLLAFSIDSIPRVWTACASNPVNSAVLVHYMLMTLMRRALLSMSEVRKNFTAWRDEAFFFHWLLCLVSLDASRRWRVCAFEAGSGILYRLFCHVSQRFCVEIWCKKKLVFSRVLKRTSMPE
jgi:hypothetical protein